MNSIGFISVILSAGEESHLIVEKNFNSRNWDFFNSGN